MDERLLILALLAVALALFAWGRWRYDLVAVVILLAAVGLGLVPPGEAFQGFAHAAVITVAAVLIISRALAAAGLVDLIAARVGAVAGGPLVQTLVLTVVVAVCSAFMNNVGALALMLPVAIRIARSKGFPVSRLLMPLAFGSLLGGLTTLIGTPPNVIIATYRLDEVGAAFGMFDYTPVGVVILAAGVALIAVLAGWVLPERRGETAPEDLFEIEGYLFEVEVDEDSELAGAPLGKLRERLEDLDYSLLGIFRGERRIVPRSDLEPLHGGDRLLIEADAEELQIAAEKAGLNLAGSAKLDPERLKGEETAVMEAVVLPEGRLAGERIDRLALPWRYGIAVLAVARQGRRLGERLRRIQLQPGDVLLLQGEREALREAANTLGALPLADRELTVGAPRKLLTAVALFAAALGAIVAGLVPLQIGLAAAAAGMVLGNVISLRQCYNAIDWPVIVLLGAMIPVGMAFEATGAAAAVADGLLAVAGAWPPPVTLGLLLVTAMLLSDVINNAAAAVLLAPVAVALAHALGLSVDPFLMAVAVGASCAFLTPIGHQSNTLVMGPAGYRFTDYWRLGLPLSLVVFAVGLPAILWVWPL